MATNASSPYEDPLRSANVTAQRIDQGVDFSGSGPIFALGPGKITSIHNSGWPGGAFIVEQLSSGDLSGRFIYYAENITPTVTVGQTVTDQTKAGDITGGIEIGFADGSGGESMARAAGQASPTGDPGEVSTGWGVAFNNVLKALGDKGGILQGKVSGAVPNVGPVGGGGGSSPSGGGGSSPLSLLGFLGLDSGQLTDYVERGVLVILGLILIMVGIWKIADPNGTKAKKAVKGAAEVAVVPK